MKYVQLSYRLNSTTPSYGGREQFVMTRTTDIAAGDPSTSSRIECGVHMGTHVDLPAHFHLEGQTVEEFPAAFWFFSSPLLLEIEPRGAVVRDELISILEQSGDHDLLLVKTGMGQLRQTDAYWHDNIGFHPDVCDAIRRCLPSVRTFGFDTISVSSFTDRALGREAHRRFLNPLSPILLLEDMDLSAVNMHSGIEQVVAAPLGIDGCEALPCTVYGVVRD